MFFFSQTEAFFVILDLFWQEKNLIEVRQIHRFASIVVKGSNFVNMTDFYGQKHDKYNEFLEHF
jgi:hypothetical protein